MNSQTAVQNEITLKPSEVGKALTYLVNAQQPLVLWGPPGVGKSQVVAQTAAAMGMEIKDVRAVLLDPVDLRGLPHVNGDNRSHWAIPEFLPRDGKGVLFLDELNRAPQLVQNACFQLVLDRKLGEYTLPEGWTVVAACNRETDGGGVTRMSSALMNRFVHLNMETDLNDVCRYALKAGWEPLLIAFLRYRPELLHQFDKNAKAFPSPRSWEFVDRVLKTKAPKDLLFALVAGTVGHAAAIEFMAFYSLFASLPSIDAILLNPAAAAVPTDVATLYAVASALARRADASNFSRIMTYLERLPVEYNVMAVRDATTRDTTLQAAPEFTKWCVLHSDVAL